MQPIVTERVAWSVCWLACHDREPCKNCWTDQDVVWYVDLGGARNHVLHCGQIPQCEWAILRGKGQPVVKYRVSCELYKNDWTDWEAIWDVDSVGSNEACIRYGAHWRHLANMIEPSMCGGNAAFCQITLTTSFCESFIIILSTLHLEMYCIFFVMSWCKTFLHLQSIQHLVASLHQCI